MLRHGNLADDWKDETKGNDESYDYRVEETVTRLTSPHMILIR